VRQTLVTGGSGFIGQHLVALLARDRRVRILDLRPPVCGRPAGTQYVNGSVLDPTVVYDALEDIDEVFHLAGLPGMWMPRKDDFHAVNCRGTEIVIDAARKRGVARFLHCSTESILFGPSSPGAVVTERANPALDDMPGAYTRSKMRAEQAAVAAACSGFPVVIANPTMPIGPHHGNLTPPALMLQHFARRRMQVYLEFVLNLVDVRDVAMGLRLAMERGQVGQRYILGGEHISLRRLLDIVGTIRGRKGVHVPVPAGFAHMTAAMMEFLADHVTRRAPAATVEGIRIAVRSKALSSEKSRNELGYTPRPIEPTLREAIEAVPSGSQWSFAGWRGAPIVRPVRPVQEASGSSWVVRAPYSSSSGLSGFAAGWRHRSGPAARRSGSARSTPGPTAPP
jgi:dihydroflavonol-4-reductase